MALTLVSYSDSEASEPDTSIKPIRSAIKSSIKPQKPSFQKLIDRSNPRQIKVILPASAKAKGQEEEEKEMDIEPPTKRMRVEGGGSGDFNSFLPAPKKPAITQAAGRRGLGGGVSLKTGATPGFSREPISTREANEEEKEVVQEVSEAQDVTYPSGSSEIPRGSQNGKDLPSTSMGSEEKLPKKGNPIMFKPLSVARKPARKRKTTIPSDSTIHVQGSQNHDQQKPTKVSLFSLEKAEDSITSDMVDGYTPLVYEPWVIEAQKQLADQQQHAIDAETTAMEMEREMATQAERETPPAAMTGPQRLDSIAADLNLSDNAKRQLLGRSWGGRTTDGQIRIANFNTDQEYAANELFRQAGEQQMHNPVRAITAGKHSLKQLVNAVASQKDALEEQFASGRRNKKEAGSRYGW